MSLMTSSSFSANLFFLASLALAAFACSFLFFSRLPRVGERIALVSLFGVVRLIIGDKDVPALGSFSTCRVGSSRVDVPFTSELNAASKSSDASRPESPGCSGDSPRCKALLIMAWCRRDDGPLTDDEPLPKDGDPLDGWRCCNVCAGECAVYGLGDESPLPDRMYALACSMTSFSLLRSAIVASNLWILISKFAMMACRAERLLLLNMIQANEQARVNVGFV